MNCFILDSSELICLNNENFKVLELVMLFNLKTGEDRSKLTLYGENNRGHD